MSETREPTPAGTAPALDYGFGEYGTAPPASGLVRLGGSLGIAACVIGLLIFVAACFGMGRVVALSFIPVALSVPGLVLSVVGAITQKRLISEDTHVLQALFTNTAGIIGGLLEMAVWLNWPLFPR